MPLFSIIVPVYNKEKTLPRCIESVLQQQCNDWELLLINDGSRDGSVREIKKYRDSRIRSLEHDNHGVSYTRNRGIREAKGEFVIFLDADDYWEDRYLESIQKNIEMYENADIYLTGLTKITTDGAKYEQLFPYVGCVEKGEMMKTFYSVQRKTQLYGYVANKVLKRSFILHNKVFFDESIRQAEDLDFFLRCYVLCHTFCYIHEVGYYYIRYESGTSKHYRNVDYFSLLEIQKRVKSFCESNMTADDMNYYANHIKDLAQAAVFEINPLKIYTLLSVVKKINSDFEISKYYFVRENIVWLMCKVFVHQLYVRLAQKVLTICRK